MLVATRLGGHVVRVGGATGRAVSPVRCPVRKVGRVSGICSQHQGYEPSCDLCNTDIREFLPDYDKKHAEAEAAGLHKCDCGFEHYRTISFCPMCSRNLPGVCTEHEKYKHACFQCRRGVQS